ncbi:MAG TPA: hypothetical protein VJ570_09230 [Holophagaceae bacterium]|nr:hypothetical protein [Holophagaceae bacterium]
MRAPALGLALLFPVALPGRAQTTVVMRGKPKEPSTWSEIQRSLRQRAEPAWVLVEDPAKPMAGALADLLKAEPLVESAFKVYSSTTEGPLGRELRGAFSWEGPRWALVNAKGQILLVGTRLPSAQDLWDQLRQAGVQTRLEVLEAFVARNPDHLEARVELLGERFSVAHRRMAPFLKPQPKPAEEERAPAPELIQAIGDDDDARIWGRLAAELERHLISGDFLKAEAWPFLGKPQEVAAFSRSMQAAASKGLTVVEDALRQSPTNWSLWSWWDKLAALAGGRPLSPLLASLTLLPGQGAQELPPEYVLKGYLRRAKAAGQWKMIRELLAPRWEAEQQTPTEVLALDVSGKAKEDGLGFSWDNYLGALLEARLRLGETQDADRMLTEILQWQPGSVSLPRRAAAVATVCGHPDLAARWGALKVAPKS